jgi:hypothetical protein
VCLAYVAVRSGYSSSSVESCRLKILVAAKAALVNFPSLSTFRIVHYAISLWQLVSYDLISNRRVFLPGTASWDHVDWVDGGWIVADSDVDN